MPRFYFHVRHHDELDEDPEGIELPSLDVAIDEAVKGAREILAEKVAKGDIVDGHQFEITTEQGDILKVVEFRSVLRLEKE
jgi:hypothetical protein